MSIGLLGETVYLRCDPCGVELCATEADECDDVTTFETVRQAREIASERGWSTGRPYHWAMSDEDRCQVCMPRQLAAGVPSTGQLSLTASVLLCPQIAPLSETVEQMNGMCRNSGDHSGPFPGNRAPVVRAGHTADTGYWDGCIDRVTSANVTVCDRSSFHSEHGGRRRPSAQGYVTAGNGGHISERVKTK